jgi:MSHA pilin protein MshC
MGAGRAIQGGPRAALLFSRPRGFTLVEMVIVIVLLGIVASIAMPRFFGASSFQGTGYAHDLAFGLRWAHKLAVAQRRDVHVSLDANGLALCYTAFPCTAPNEAPGPDNSKPYALPPPSGVTLATSHAAFSFDALGQPSVGPITVTVTGGISHTITVEAETGYVHES